ATHRGIERNRLPLIGRFQILDNLRRTLLPPSLVLLLAAGAAAWPGPALLVVAAVLAVLARPVYPAVGRFLLGPGPQQRLPVFFRATATEIGTALAQTLLGVTFLAYHAWEMAHAIVLTLVRVVVTQRRLLEWETAAAVAARAAGLVGKDGVRSFFAQMIASPATVLLLLFVAGPLRPSALPAVAPILALWLVAPFAAYWLSRPVEPEPAELDEEERAFLRRVAFQTWTCIDLLTGPDDHGLPIDNLQETPGPIRARRTSPTNVAMALLSMIAAERLGFLRTPDMA